MRALPHCPSYFKFKFSNQHPEASLHGLTGRSLPQGPIDLISYPRLWKLSLFYRLNFYISCLFLVTLQNSTLNLHQLKRHKLDVWFTFNWIVTNHLNITHWNVSVWMCFPASLPLCTLLGSLNSLPVPAYPHSSWSNAVPKRVWYPLHTILNSVWQENETMWEVQPTATHVIPFTRKILETGIGWWSKLAAEAGLP